MAFERLGDKSLDYKLCNYEESRLTFRGPQRRLEGDYVACLGGTDTYGKFIEQPYPTMIEARTGIKCVNFGWPNAGVDVYLNDDGVLRAASRSKVTVLQVPCVTNMSNRFYSVHPRRNDRFLEASGILRAIYGEVDFTEFHFVRHMLSHLQTVSASRFGMLRDEMQTAWVARMQLLLQKIEGDVILLWLSSRRPDEDTDKTEIAYDPSFVTRRMIEKLTHSAARLVEITASDTAKAEGTKGMRFSELEATAAGDVLGPTVHYEVADALAPLITGMSGK